MLGMLFMLGEANSSCARPLMKRQLQARLMATGSLTRCQGFICPAFPSSRFLQDEKDTAYGCVKFPNSMELVGCGVQKPSALHLKKGMSPS